MRTVQKPNPVNRSSAYEKLSKSIKDKIIHDSTTQILYEYIKKRINVEDEYVKKLTDLDNEIIPEVDNIKIIEVIYKLKTYWNLRKESSEKYCSILEEYLQDFFNSNTNQIEVNEDYIKEYEFYSDDVNNKLAQCKYMYDKYEKSTNEVEALLKDFDKKCLTPRENTKKEEYFMNIRKKLNECKKALINYNESICKGQISRINFIKTATYFSDISENNKRMELENVQLFLKSVLIQEIHLKNCYNESSRDEKALLNITTLINEIDIPETEEAKNKRIDKIHNMIPKFIFKKIMKNEKIMAKFNDFVCEGNPFDKFDVEAAMGYKEDEIENKDILMKINRIVQLCWNGVGISQADLEEFREIIAYQNNRELFCGCMNQHRSAGDFILKLNGFKYISGLMLEFLDCVEKTFDIKSAQEIMILSETYYYKYNETDKDAKIFLQQMIVNHKLFKNIEFWDKVINKVSSMNENTEIDGEKVMNHVNTEYIFSQLITHSCNMISFGFDSDLVEDKILKVAEEKDISEELITDIKNILKSTLDDAKEKYILRLAQTENAMKLMKNTEFVINRDNE